VILLFLHYTGPRSFNKAQVKPAKLPSISELLSYKPPQPPSVADSTHQVHLCTLISHFNARILMFTEVISPRDHRSGLFDDAKRKEIDGLLNRGTFKLELRSELESNPNIVPSRFVLAIKHKESGAEVLKARFVLGVHKDRDKRHVVHNATNLKKSSIRILLALPFWVLTFGLETSTKRIFNMHLTFIARFPLGPIYYG
jgi:hypothetical protein